MDFRKNRPGGQANQYGESSPRAAQLALESNENVRRIPMKSICAALLVAAMLLVARPLSSGERLGTLEGTVERDGHPLAGARVTAEEAEGAHPHATLTNNDGRFFFPRLTPGLYNLRAYYKGTWSGWEKNAEVKVGKGTNVTLHVPVSATK
jgi:hypothetical protein